MSFTNNLIRLITLTVLANSSYTMQINTNQNFLDLSQEKHAQELLKSFEEDVGIYDELYKQLEDVLTKDDLESFIKNTQKMLEDKKRIEESIKEKEESSTEDVITKDENNHLSTQQEGNDSNSSGLLVFLDENGQPQGDPNSADLEETFDQSDSQPTYILTDDKSLNILDYGSINNLKSIYYIEDDLPNFNKGDRVLLIINKPFDTIELIKYIDKLLESINHVFVSTNNDNNSVYLPVIEKYSEKIHYIPNLTQLSE